MGCFTGTPLTPLPTLQALARILSTFKELLCNTQLTDAGCFRASRDHAQAGKGILMARKGVRASTTRPCAPSMGCMLGGRAALKAIPPKKKHPTSRPWGEVVGFTKVGLCLRPGLR